jgi:UDP-N-acetylmuramoylalanine--D-glutamate ligase
MNTRLNTLTQQALEARRDASVKPDEHSMEAVAAIEGVLYVNDSAATSVQATRISLQQVEGNVLLITGGDDHRNDYASLLAPMRGKVRTVIYLGSDNDRLLKHISKEDMLFIPAISIEEAVKFANYCTKEGDMVLFSPACPSFDAFDNYKNRGNRFRKCVNNLTTGN